MAQILALTSEKQILNQLKSSLAKSSDIEFYHFAQSLDLIDHFLYRYAHLVLLDLDLLNEDILKLIRVLRSVHRDTKIVLILSRENMPICSAALSQGVISYQIKPLSEESLLKIISSALQAPLQHH